MESHWMCGECHYLFKAPAPPEKCPHCRRVCAIYNVTCYIPECGGEANPDTRLVAERLQEKRG
jgi:rubredoxin